MEAAIAGGATTPILQVGQNLCQCLFQQIRYIKNFHKNFKKLEEEEKNLYNRRDDVNIIINNAKAQMMPTVVCEAWLKKVEIIQTQISDLKSKYVEVKNNRCGCLNVLSFLKLSKQMEEMVMDVCNLREAGKLENGIVIERPPEPVEMKHVKKMQDVPSRDGILEKIMEYLSEENIKRIGIWGMEGVGKTTIMKHLNDAPRMAKDFEIIIWVTTKKDSNLRDMQQKIVQRLKLPVDSQSSIDQIAPIISKELENKKYLLLLDGVFSKFNLYDLGIRDNHNFGKVVLAARCRNVIREMGTHEEIYVERLSKDDAWKMFRQKVGDEVVDHPHIKPLARMVAKECGELPQMIDVVAATLRKMDNEDMWWYTLRKLQSSSINATQHREDLDKLFKHAYDQLPDDTQKCFLYGILYPDDHEVHTGYLIECWSAEGFMCDAQNFREAQETGNVILEDLIGKCLLERSERLEYVKLPILFRRSALRITSLNKEGNKLLVKAGQVMQHTLSENEWKQSIRISLIDTQLRTLPERPTCCMISTLLLQRNSTLKTIHEPFFGYMCGLRVLDLYRTSIESLPPSLSSLLNLKALYLNSCSHLMELPTQIVELTKLEVLDLRKTGIIDLPRQIGKLSSLKCLRVSFANVGNPNDIERVLIPQNVISGLYLLEELSIDVEPYDQRWTKNVDVVVEEVASLELLSTLCFYFPRMDCCKSFIGNSKSWNNNSVSWENNCFRSFKLLVGSLSASRSHEFKGIEHSMKRHLIFCAGEDIPPEILKVLAHTQAFELVNHQNVQKLSDLGTERMEGLKFCLIEECLKMESIIDGDMTIDCVFPFLERLLLIRLPQLETIWKGSIRSACFAKLSTLKLNECHKLKNIFSRGMIQQLSKLQELKVENCLDMEEVIDKDVDILESNALPRLRTLELVNLPNLSRICQCSSLDWPSLERIEIMECVELKSLPFTSNNAEKLRLIECKHDWWNNLVWQDDAVRGRLQDVSHFI
ncbi:probable disease resistance protein At5g63020 [Macadamia integrifolia]|uniref:probable disease resistance protein At5g63020 n=1 Tax=Macadamia integrifolia TaxID=60698 RepID=UPI001C4F1E5F|nr:probable disease resistance protein At5g63020 [Macadamia integrifolia]XP_042513748.1 probable disease resistance protein At5g63020 [Macadamia integrifolia]XP_042513749.1 probable disease resistance protein At5g63020 [Macadamia integrifolia]